LIASVSAIPQSIPNISRRPTWVTPDSDDDHFAHYPAFVTDFEIDV
jgi:hypothetical protein